MERLTLRGLAHLPLELVQIHAELLAEVYSELIGARQAQFILAQAAAPIRVANEPIVLRERPALLPPRLSEDERAAHRRFIATLGENAIWRDYIRAEEFMLQIKP